MKHKFKLNALSKTTAEILLYGFIGSYGDVKAKDILAEIKKAEDEGYKVLNIRINSGGGDVFEGMAIVNAMKRSSLQIDTYNDGLAASMASVILVCGDNVYMAKNARIMIHQASSFTEGQSDDLKRTAELMDQMNEEFSEIYAKRTSKTKDWIMENWMAHGKDMWFTAKEAKAHGLVTKLVDGLVEEPEATNSITRLVAHYDGQLNKQFKSQNKSQTMNLKAIFKALNSIQLDGAPVVTLSAQTDEDSENLVEISNAITQLGSKITTLSAELSTEKAERQKAETKIKELEQQNLTDKADSLVDTALSVGKITASEVDSYKKLAAANFEETKKILDARKAHQSINGRINNADPGADDDVLKLSWDEADQKGKLSYLKANHFEHFKAIYKKEFNQDYKG